MSEQRRARGVAVSGLLAAALLLIAALPARTTAQEMDARWLPWVGCWQPVGEPSEAPLLCLRPIEGEVGVEIVTVAAGEVASREIVRADEQPREATREGCEGWERYRFSNDARRVYVRSEHVCEGGVERTSTGMMAMASSTEWVDVRSVEVAGETDTWVQRYRLATTTQAEAAGFGDIAADRVMAVRAARSSAAAAPDIDDVIDASAEVHAKTVEAWLVERGRRFDLDGDKLIRLADAGVPSSVIDVVVAVSYPNRFTLGPDQEYEAVAESSTPRRERYGYGYYSPFRWGLAYLPFGYGYSPFGYSPFSYSPFDYGYGYGYGYGPVVVTVERRDSGGRVVNGRGYSRGTRSTGVSRDLVPSGRGGGASVGRSSGASGGSASGSGGSSTGRTAKPRGGR